MQQKKLKKKESQPTIGENSAPQMESIKDEDESDQTVASTPLTAGNNATPASATNTNTNTSKLIRLPSEKRVEFSIGSSKILSSKQHLFRPKSALKRFNMDNTK